MLPLVVVASLKGPYETRVCSGACLTKRSARELQERGLRRMRHSRPCGPAAAVARLMLHLGRKTVRILRLLLMLLAILSFAGHPASAASDMHGHKVSLHASHQHHHAQDVADASHEVGAAEHGHEAPVHKHAGRSCDGACCALNCLSAAAAPILGGSAYMETAEVRVVASDTRPDGETPFVPDRPPIIT